MKIWMCDKYFSIKFMFNDFIYWLYFIFFSTIEK